MKMTGSQAVMKCLMHENVKIIFGYPGGAIMPIYDALYDYSSKIRHVLVRHEQGATHAAEGYARMTGKPGVVFATSGPGATNLITGLADAMLDSVPLVCITGQVASAFIGTDAFQEADVMGVTTPVTKWNYQVTKAEEIPYAIAKAFHIANTGRPGPVVIDITKDAQFEEFEFRYPKQVVIPGFQPTVHPHPKQIELAASLLNKAKKPLILIGHGILIANAEKELLEFAEKGGFPIASTLHGLSAFPAEHPLYVGYLGMHGNYGPNIMANKADVVLAIGMRFDDRVTGKVSEYLTKARIIHIDIDPAELNKNVKVTVPIVADAKIALQEINKLLKQNTHTYWLTEFKKCDEKEFNKIIQSECHPKSGMIKMPEVICLLSKKTKGEAVIITDVGQHQMIAARYYKPSISDSFISSGGMGTMGFALPAAIGVKCAVDKRQVICVSGDGGFQMNIQELATIAQEKLPVKIIILNNTFLGMVRQWQELFFDRRYSMVQLQNPDFVQVAKGFFITGEEVTQRATLSQALDRLLQAETPYLLNIMVEKEDNVFPMVPTGASVDEVRLE